MQRKSLGTVEHVAVERDGGVKGLRFKIATPESGDSLEESEGIMWTYQMPNEETVRLSIDLLARLEPYQRETVWRAVEESD